MVNNNNSCTLHVQQKGLDLASVLKLNLKKTINILMKGGPHVCQYLIMY